jgi:hypothetical protein
MNLRLKTYKTPAGIRRTGEKYIDQIAGFKGETWARYIIRPEDVTARAVELVVPPAASRAQARALRELIEYGRGKGVDVKIVVIP